MARQYVGLSGILCVVDGTSEEDHLILFRIDVNVADVIGKRLLLEKCRKGIGYYESCRQKYSHGRIQ